MTDNGGNGSVRSGSLPVSPLAPLGNSSWRTSRSSYSRRSAAPKAKFVSVFSISFKRGERAARQNTATFC